MRSWQMCTLLVPMMFFCTVFAAEAKSGKSSAAMPATAAQEPAAPSEFPRKHALASADEIIQAAARAGSKQIFIDARSPDEYAQGHLPGAFNLPSDTFQGIDRPPYFLAAPETLQKTCAAMGVSADSRIVIYDEHDGRLAARIWFVLHACGHNQAAILNGGLAAWKAAKQPVTVQVPARPAAGTFVPAAELRNVCAFSDLARFKVRVHALGKLPSVTLLDARSLAEYMGEEVRAKYGGHIPGAVNMEWSAVMSGAEGARVWRSPPEIHAMLHLAGVEKNQPLAVYDQAGGRSSHLFFTLWLMGYDQIFNYTAGWREYGQRSDVEVER